LSSGKTTQESEGVKPYALVSVGLIALLVVGWLAWLNRAMGGDGGPARQPTATARAPLAPDARPGVPTPFQLGASPSPPPVAAATPFALAGLQPFPTHTPLPAATATPEATATPGVEPTLVPTRASQVVRVRVSSYWPDDGPNWCADWDVQAGVCASNTTSGVDWRRLIHAEAAACDPAWLGRTVVSGRWG